MTGNEEPDYESIYDWVATEEPVPLKDHTNVVSKERARYTAMLDRTTQRYNTLERKHRHLNLKLSHPFFKFMQDCGIDLLANSIEVESMEEMRAVRAALGEWLKDMRVDTFTREHPEDFNHTIETLTLDIPRVRLNYSMMRNREIGSWGTTRV